MSFSPENVVFSIFQTFSHRAQWSKQLFLKLLRDQIGPFAPMISEVIKKINILVRKILIDIRKDL